MFINRKKLYFQWKEFIHFVVIYFFFVHSITTNSIQNLFISFDDWFYITHTHTHEWMTILLPWNWKKSIFLLGIRISNVFFLVLRIRLEWFDLCHCVCVCLCIYHHHSVRFFLTFWFFWFFHFISISLIVVCVCVCRCVYWNLNFIN